jgi:HEAT repeat protein
MQDSPGPETGASDPEPQSGATSPAIDDQALARDISETITSLLKAIRARQTYVAGNPLIEKFHGDLQQHLTSLWDSIPHLTLAVDEGRLLWNDVEVYAKPVGPDNFAFQFFKDGIRLLAFFPGVENTELADFLEILARRRTAQDDLLASLWHRDFSAIRMEYVDAAGDEDLEIPEPDRGAGAGESIGDMSEIEEAKESGPLPVEDEANYAELALSEADLTYLRRELEAEWERPLVRDVTLAFLDQFEMRDQERRRQVVDILRELLPRLLSGRDFANVALIVNELQLLANKTGEIETQELVTSLLRDMSEAIAEIVSSGERGEEGPEAEEVDALLGALQAEAIPTLVRAIPAVSSTKTRRQLSEALDRLVAAHPHQITSLLGAQDPVLAAEAARIVGRLRIMEAEPSLVELARRPEQVARQAAIEALAALGSLAGVQALAVGLADGGRDIRLAALSAVAKLRPDGAAEMIQKWVESSEIEGRDQTEQMAFFKAYATVAGTAAVQVLDGLLNDRRWWGKRRPSSLRASAARALGFIEAEEARAALQKACGDRAAPVRSAVRVALRSLESDSPAPPPDTAIPPDGEGDDTVEEVQP